MNSQKAYAGKIKGGDLGQRPRVLVVEDTYNVRALLSYNLNREGYEVKAVDSPDSVLSLLGDWKPEVILMDIMMPGSHTSVVDLCLEIKDSIHWQNITIILVSGITQMCSTSSEQIKLSLKADDFFPKPFDISKLLERIQKAVKTKGKATAKVLLPN